MAARASTETVVLRYSNQEARTVESHDSVAAQAGAVWWGWWRKDFEPTREDVLQRLRRTIRTHGPLTIGLLNRKDEEWASAECVDLELAGSRKTIPAPDTSLVPCYYQDKLLPAWFLLRNLVLTRDLDSYVRRFGEVPVGEPTIYELRRQPNGPLVPFPKPSWSLNPRKAPGEYILHLSDLHFGESHGYPATRPLPGRAVRAQTLSDKLLESLRDTDVGVIVISGDLITKGNADDFDAVEAFAERLLKGLRLNPDNVVITPGNHDFKTLAEGSMPTIDYSHEKAFRRFLSSFYGSQNGSLELERVHRFRTPTGWDLLFFALNSARLRGDEVREYGYVGRHRYEEMISFATESLGPLTDPESKRMAFGVLHHHVVPVQPELTPQPGRSLSLTVDAGELLTEMQERSIRFLLHGHQHLPHVSRHVVAVRQRSTLLWPDDDRCVYVIANGSSGASAAELCTARPYNTYGLYTPRARGLSVRMDQYLPGISAEPFCQAILTW